MATSTFSPLKIVLWVSLAWCVIMVFVGEGWVTRVIEKERSFNHAFYSEDAANAAEQRANRWFNGCFVDTGVVEHTYNLFARTPDPKMQSPFDDGAKPLVLWFEGVLRTFWTILWHATLRLSHLCLWAPYALFMIVPWVIDGLVSRKIKQHTYDFTSPLQHRYSIMAVYFIALAAILMLTAPMPLPPVAIPIALLAFCIFTHRIFANYVKRA